MLTSIQDRKTIRASQKQLLKRLEESGANPLSGTVGFPGGRMRAKVFAPPRHGFWLGYRELENRFWNGLGVDEFKDGTSAPVVEVNPPLLGPDARIQGAFAEDEEGRIYLAHRGRLGGGKKNIGRNFLSWYPKELVIPIRDGNRSVPMILIGRLDAQRFVGALGSFARLAAQFRDGNKAPRKSDAEKAADDVYFDEYSGSTTYQKKSGIIVVDFVHGRVVKALNAAITQSGVPTAKDANRDLVARLDGRESLYEVKTSADTQSLYTAVGQLAWHSVARTSKVAVVPKHISQAARKRLEHLGISVVTWSGKGKIVFSGLQATLPLPDPF